MRETGGAVLTSIADVANTVMPLECRLCGGAMTSLSTVRVCDARVGAETAERDGTVCARCGDALGMESARFAAAMGITCCTMCRLAPPDFERAVAGGDCNEDVREMLHLLKFAGRRQVAELVLGEKLARAAVKRVEKIAPEWRLRVEANVLVRVKDTRPLFYLSPRQRRASLRGAFRVVKKEMLVGREVLLVDDILTTGSTARECAQVLLRAGATKVWVAMAAKVQPEGSQSERVESMDVAMWGMGDSNPMSQKRDMGHPVKLVEPDVSRQRGFGQ
jgi:predicted amidophosphoribosyltransferase